MELTMLIEDIFPSKYLKASDLNGQDLPVVIQSADIVQFDDGNKIEVTLAGQSKTFVCNKTNAKAIATAYSSDTNAWHGCNVILFPMMVDTPNGPKEAIRVRIPATVQQPIPRSLEEGVSRAQTTKQTLEDVL